MQDSPPPKSATESQSPIGQNKLAYKLNILSFFVFQASVKFILETRGGQFSPLNP